MLCLKGCHSQNRVTALRQKTVIITGAHTQTGAAVVEGCARTDDKADLFRRNGCRYIFRRFRNSESTVLPAAGQHGLHLCFTDTAGINKPLSGRSGMGRERFQGQFAPNGPVQHHGVRGPEFRQRGNPRHHRGGFSLTLFRRKAGAGAEGQLPGGFFFCVCSCFHRT